MFDKHSEWIIPGAFAVFGALVSIGFSGIILVNSLDTHVQDVEKWATEKFEIGEAKQQEIDSRLRTVEQRSSSTESTLNAVREQMSTMQDHVIRIEQKLDELIRFEKSRS